MKAKDLIATPPKILIHGPAGSGKTALVAQAGGGYMLDFDSGMRTALNLKDEFFQLRQQIEFDTFSDADPRTPDAWLKAKKKIFEIRALCDKGNWPFDALIIDSLTKMGICCYNQIMFQVGKAMGKPSLPDWSLMISDMRNMLQLILTLPKLVIITAHQEHLDVNGEVYLKIKALGQKLGSELPALMDEVWQMKIKNAPQGKVNFIVSWKPNPYIEIRTRSGHFKEVVINNIGLVGLFKEINYTYKKGG